MEIGNCFGRKCVMRKEERCRVAAEYRTEMGGWHRGREKQERSGKSILKICIIQILRKRLQSTCVALMEFREVTT